MSQQQQQLQLRSRVRAGGRLELSLEEIAMQPVRPGEVRIRIEAAPLNPSDQGLLFGAADMSTARASGTADRPVVTADINAAGMQAMAGRLEQSMPVGNEGAGVVVEAGESAAARSLVGKTVAVLGGAMYSQYRTVQADQCLVLPPGVTPAQGAAAFVNPLTALGMVETLRREGHHGLVHTAAASNLGQMLLKICLADGVALVNVVRGAAQAALLQSLGATHVCDSSDTGFAERLADAVASTKATLAFDAIGGGPLAGQILTALETAAIRGSTAYSRYGSTVHKQVYIYGGLDLRPTELKRDYGMAWAVGGWLVTPFLEKIGAAAVDALKQRVAAEITTTFASRYARRISLAEALHLDEIAVYRQRATGQKFLIEPRKP